MHRPSPPPRSPLARPGGRIAARVIGLAMLATSGLGAQQAPVGPVQPAPAGAVRPRAAAHTTTADSARRPARRAGTATAPARPGLEPPITPRRAFLTSLLFPGAGQSRLQRPGAGAGFFLVELGAFAMLQKSLGDLREAKALRAGTDSIPSEYPIDNRRATPEIGFYNENLVRARRLHVEDWGATLVFNHLIAGAEAFVAAQLWEVPAQVAVRTTPRGRPALVVALTW